MFHSSGFVINRGKKPSSSNWLFARIGQLNNRTFGSYGKWRSRERFYLKGLYNLEVLQQYLLSVSEARGWKWFPELKFNSMTCDYLLLQSPCHLHTPLQVHTFGLSAGLPPGPHGRNASQLLRQGKYQIYRYSISTANPASVRRPPTNRARNDPSRSFYNYGYYGWKSILLVLLMIKTLC